MYNDIIDNYSIKIIPRKCGHEPPGLTAVLFRETISKEFLRKIVGYAREWEINISVLNLKCFDPISSDIHVCTVA